jgi:hypothetical protein
MSALHPPSHPPNHSPLVAIVNPPEVLSGLPGDQLQISIVVQNLGDQSAIIDVLLQADSAILQWCGSTRQRLGLGSEQTGEVIFEFVLPSTALPGNFDYTLVIDAPNHYPNDTPIHFDHRLQVLSKAQTAVSIYDPTFFLKPATNSQQPARLKPGEILPFEVQVENCSSQTDQFRLVSEDAEEDWLTIRYPNLDKNAPGRIQEDPCLNLNPGDRGTIRLEVHPPIDTLAGLYSPALRLHSTNHPDLKRLDFIYIEIEPIETCRIELEAILDRVSYRSGEYQIRFANQGNVFRQLSFSASSREEEEWLTYDFEPDQLRLPPGREAQVQLRVTPFRKRRRPWLRQRTLPFQVNLQDAQGYQLAEPSLQAALIWQSRPWWQLALGILLALSLVSGAGFLIWWLFFKPPAPVIIEEFNLNSLEYIEGDSVNLNWRVLNPDRIQSLTLTTQVQDAASEAKPIQPKTFEFTESSLPADLPDSCPEPERLCQQYDIGKLAAGHYEFKLQPSVRSGSAPEPGKLAVSVAAKPDPQVKQFASTQAEYQPGESVSLNWVIENASQLAALSVTATHQSTNRSQVQYLFSQGIPKALQSVCQRKGENLNCSQVPIPGLQAGTYTFELQATTVKGKQIQSAPTPSVSVKPKPLRIVSFVVNGRTGGGNVKLSLNQSLKISWQVEGGEGTVKVNITPYGSLPASGSQDFGKFATTGSHPIQITATDAAGQEVSSAGFLVTVVAPPSPPSTSPSSRLRAPIPQQK